MRIKKIMVAVISIFSRLFKTKKGMFIDERDGTVYKTVKIGNQIWLAENLAYKASDGCWAYNNDNSYVEKYGYLYDWETANNVCPQGWHLPTDDEWGILEETLKDRSVAEINENNNGSGFNALPGGWHVYHDGAFYDAGKYGYWWTSTPFGSSHACNRDLSYNNGKVIRSYYNRKNGFSIRCLKD